MTKKSITISLIFAFNAIIQFLNQIVITRVFGAKLDLEIFLAAVTIPTIFVSAIFATLNDAFLPIYGDFKNKSKGKNSQEYLISTVIFTTLLFLLISLLLILLSYPLSSLFYSARGTEFVQNVAFQMKYLFISLPLAVITTLLGSYLYAHKKFYRFPIGQFLGNLLILLLVITLHNFLGIWVMVLSFILSLTIQILIVFPYKLKIKLPRINFKNQILLLINWFPLILSYFLFRSENLIIRSMASFLPQGYFVYLNLASNFFALTAGITTIGIQIILLPHLVDYFANKNTITKGLRLVKKAKIISLVITSITAIIVLLVAPIIINLLFVGGKFTQNDANITISIIPFFIIPAIGWGSYPVFFQPLMAIKKNYQITFISFVSIFWAWILAIVSKNIFGPIVAISIGLTTLLLSGIILSEILWQKEKSILLTNKKSQ